MKSFKSLSFVYYKPGDVRLEERTVTCGPTDVVARVIAVGRCGTDRTVFLKGHPKVDPHAPIVLGHELVAEVIAVGSEVKQLRNGIGYKEGGTLSEEYLDFKPGERLTAQSRIARYRNGLMLLSDPITILSFYIDAAYAQYIRFPEELIRSGSLLRVPESVSDEEAALTEPAACVLESVFSTPHPVGVDEQGRHIFRAGIQQGGRCCIIGSGTLAMIYAKVCRAEGAATVIIIVRSEQKKQLIRSIMGDSVDVLIQPPYSDCPLEEKLEIEKALVAELTQRTEGHLFDDVVSACPNPDAQRLMLELYAPEGYAVGACFGGTHTRVDAANIDSNHYRTAKTIGTSGCSTRGMETVLRWLGEGRLSLAGLTSQQRFNMRSDPNEFFTAKLEGLKPVLYPWE